VVFRIANIKVGLKTIFVFLNGKVASNEECSVWTTNKRYGSTGDTPSWIVVVYGTKKILDVLLKIEKH